MSIKKICGYEADRCHAYLKNYLHICTGSNYFIVIVNRTRGVAVGFVGYMAAVSDGGGHGMKVT